MRDPLADDRIGLLPLACAVALSEAALAAGIPARRLTLKWPNDFMLDGRKTAGILLDATQEPDGSRIIVAGFGVNILHAPASGLYPAATLNEVLPKLTPANLFSHLARTFPAALAALDATDGPARTVEHWLSGAQGVGEPLTVRYDEYEETGTFAGLDAEGYLLLQQSDGAKRIMAGDVFFGGAATPNPQEPALGAGHTP